jgi:hypothetical protein
MPLYRALRKGGVKMFYDQITPEPKPCGRFQSETAKGEIAFDEDGNITFEGVENSQP